MKLNEKWVIRDRFEVKTFFLETTMILEKKREIRDQRPFFRKHQFLAIFASGP